MFLDPIPGEQTNDEGIRYFGPKVMHQVMAAHPSEHFELFWVFIYCEMRMRSCPGRIFPIHTLFGIIRIFILQENMYATLVITSSDGGLGTRSKTSLKRATLRIIVEGVNSLTFHLLLTNY